MDFSKPLLFLISIHDFLDPNTSTPSILGYGVEFRNLPAALFRLKIQLFPAPSATAKVFLRVQREGCKAETTQRLSPAQFISQESPIRLPSSQFRGISESISAISSMFSIPEDSIRFPHQAQCTYQHSAQIPLICRISPDDALGFLCVFLRLL
jgi:hypothetical protein